MCDGEWKLREMDLVYIHFFLPAVARFSLTTSIITQPSTHECEYGDKTSVYTILSVQFRMVLADW